MESFYGYIDTTQDAYLVVEACRGGKCPLVKRRLTEKERLGIRSGSIFVFNEQESNIRRWTDGMFWSPSRILGSFLVYRQLDKRISNQTGAGGKSLKSVNDFKVADFAIPLKESNSTARSSNSSSPSQFASSSNQNLSASVKLPAPIHGPKSSTGNLPSIHSLTSGVASNVDNSAAMLLSSITNKAPMGVEGSRSTSGSASSDSKSVNYLTNDPMVNEGSSLLVKPNGLGDVLDGKLPVPTTSPFFSGIQISQDWQKQQSFRRNANSASSLSNNQHHHHHLPVLASRSSPYGTGSSISSAGNSIRSTSPDFQTSGSQLKQMLSANEPLDASVPNRIQPRQPNLNNGSIWEERSKELERKNFEGLLRESLMASASNHSGSSSVMSISPVRRDLDSASALVKMEIDSIKGSDASNNNNNDKNGQDIGDEAFLFHHFVNSVKRSSAGEQ